MNKVVLGGLLYLMMNSVAMSELNVIADLGGESAVRFYEAIQPEHDDNAPAHPNALPATIGEEDMLPVVSHLLTPGQVSARALDLPGMQPLFLVGDDPTSISWLTANQEKLTELNAVGLVVNVKTLSQLNKLRTLVPELQLLPVPADDLAKRLKINHYPVLMTERGFSQ